MPKAVFVVLLVFVAVIVLGAVWVGVSYAIVSPPGSAVSEQRQVPGFTKVQVHGAGTLIITQGSAPGLVVEGKRPVLDRLTTTVSGDTLLLEPHGVWYAPITYSGADRVTYRLTVTELTGIEAHGATRIESAQPLTTDGLALSTSGAALVAGKQPPPIRFGFFPWVMRALPLVPVAQCVDVAATARTLGRWRREPALRPGGGSLWKRHIVPPLAPSLALMAGLGLLRRRGLLPYLRLYMPDLAWVVTICGGFAALWCVTRPLMMLVFGGLPRRTGHPLQGIDHHHSRDGGESGVDREYLP